MFGIGESEVNALKLLEKDHDEVDALFKQYESGKERMKAAQKQKLATQICDMLTVHAMIEEEIFYPAIRNLDEETKDLVAEAAVEHQSLKDIIGRLESAPPSDPLYDAGVKVLAEYVKHHVKEEENEIFPKVRSSDLDLDALGERLMERKSELEGQGSRARGGKRGSNSKSQESRAG
jgi:hemerythrin superfamily protein